MNIKIVSNYLKLKYRRQFIATFTQLEQFSHWQHVTLPEVSFHIYAHPELYVSRVIANPENGFYIIAIGFVIDPANPLKGTNEILGQLMNSHPRTIEFISLLISNLAGRFVIFVAFGKSLYVFHDPCGQRSVYYGKCNGFLYLASQPLIFAELFALQNHKCADAIRNSNYVKHEIEYWFPSSLSFYENINKLIPNHYLDVSRQKQIRYWPIREIAQTCFENTCQETADILKKMMVSAHSKFKLALSLSAGWDSRVVLAASKDIINDVFLYSYIIRSLNPRSPDIKVPHSMSNKLGLKHHILDWRRTADGEYRKVYKSNVDTAHDDWCDIVFGASINYPQDRICVQGSCSEIVRCFYYPCGTHDQIKSAKELIEIVQPAWKDLPLIENCLDGWLRDAQTVCTKNNIDILDLFYWEHRVGSWLAQSQTESDILREVFTPFNYRPLLSKMLGIPYEYRIGETNFMYWKIVETLWPELLNWPINPPFYGWVPKMKHVISWKYRRSIRDRIKKASINLLKKTGLYEQARKTYRFFKQHVHKRHPTIWGTCPGPFLSPDLYQFAMWELMSIVTLR